MSFVIRMRNPLGEPPPPASRLYWICQAAGWGSFVLYTLGFYLVFATARWEIVLSIVVIDGVLCPALTHALRNWMYRRGWMKLPARSRLPRAIAAAFGLAIAVSALCSSSHSSFRATGDSIGSARSGCSSRSYGRSTAGS